MGMGDACAFLQQEFGVDSRFALIAWLPAHSPREFLRIAPLCRASGDEQLRHLLRVHVFVYRGIARRSQRTEDQQNFIAFDELAGLLHRLWRDRKSTRLNSSHLGISYAVFCLKKKKSNTLHR